MNTVSFGDLARGAYCLRQLYYARQDEDRSLPESARERIALSFEYDRYLGASDRTLEAAPIATDPDSYRSALGRLADRPYWPALAEPDAIEVFLAGKDCHGVATKVLEPTRHDAGETPIPTIATPGEPPAWGVWEPQSVRAIAAAYALSWERETQIEQTLVEYPAYGVVRS
ncbi:MAG: hypothetical protein ACQETB_13555, partial [Halobacteriota archaeon]